MIVCNKNFNIFYQFLKYIKGKRFFKLYLQRKPSFFKDYIGNYIMKILVSSWLENKKLIKSLSQSNLSLIRTSFTI